MARVKSKMSVRTDQDVSARGERRVTLVNTDFDESVWEIVMSHNGDELKISRTVMGEGLVVAPQATNVVTVRYDG